MSYTYRGITDLPDYTQDADVEFLARKLVDGLRAGKTESAYTAAHTLTAADVGNLITCDGTWTLTVPKNSVTAFTYAPCTIMPIQNIDSGTITITPVDGDVTILGADLTLGAYEAGTLTKFLVNTWIFAKGGGVPFASATGGTVTTYTASGHDYEIHTYTATGSNLVITKTGLADVLCVGGGGGGALGAGGGAGGGGGGGVVAVQAYLLAGTYPVTVGLGGTGGGLVANTDPYKGRNGGASYVAGIGAAGGGGGGDAAATPNAFGLAGGSGGGGGSGGAGVNAGGAGIAGQGYAGGASIAGASPYPVGGGGGAGAVGANGAGSASGAGGAGVANTWYDNTTRYYGGGGGGSETAWGATPGAGGTGGGGAGHAATGVAGTANTGGGGGGGRTTVGGAGGSGIVIVRIRLT